MGSLYSEAIATTYSFEGNKPVKEPTGDISVKGVRQTNYNEFAKQMGIPTKDVRQLTEQERQAYISQEFWSKPNIDKLPPEISKQVFDFAYNSGPQTAIKHLQKVVGAEVDGMIGPQTLSKVVEYETKNGKDTLKNDYLDTRLEFMKGLATKYPSKYKEFLPGWEARINTLKGK